MKGSVMENIFTKHPKSINESYTQHLFFALKNGSKLAFIGLILIIHGFFPFIFQHKARDGVEKLSQQLLNRNPKKSEEYIRSE